MIDRRTFLKLSAGALVLTAAGALTGCGDTVIEKTSGVAKIGDVTFICATPFLGGGLGDGIVKQLTYWTKFTIQNNSAERELSSRRTLSASSARKIQRKRCISSGRNWSQSRVRQLTIKARQSSIWKPRKVCRKRIAPAPMNCVCATMVKPLCSSMETTAKM